MVAKPRAHLSGPFSSFFSPLMFLLPCRTTNTFASVPAPLQTPRQRPR